MALTLLASNNASSVLAAGISASATTLTVNTGTGALFPIPVASASYFKLTLIDAATGTLTEIVHVTAVSGDVFTVSRGQEGTTARIWSANDIAANMFTSGTLAALLQTNNYLSEIKAAGTAAVSAAVANLGLGTGLSGIVGSIRNAVMSIAAASASATFTADELIVETPTGTQYRLNSFSKSINVTTVGAGGMDVALSTTAYVAIYAIYNPTTGASALLGVLSTTSVTSLYSGTAMPAGYTASALVSIWLVSSSQLSAGYQVDREVFCTNQAMLAGNAATTTPAVATYATAAFPIGTKTISGYITVTAAASQTAEVWLLGRPTLNQGQRAAINGLSISSGGIGQTFLFSRQPISTTQILYYAAYGSTASSFAFGLNLTGYSF